MKCIIAGSRTAVEADVVYAMAACGFAATITTVVSGGARGADRHGETWARRNRIPVERHDADWKAFGKAAGPLRNRKMADLSDALVAVWDGKSRGTKHMIETARAKGLEVYVHQMRWRP